MCVSNSSGQRKSKKAVSIWLSSSKRSLESIADFFRNHIVGMAIFAIVTGLAGSFLWDHIRQSEPVRQTFVQGAGPPVSIPLSNFESIVGKHPYEVVATSEVRDRFKQLLGPHYAPFRDRIQVASPVEYADDAIFGRGLAPRGGGSEEAAFAIEKDSGDLYAAMLVDGIDFDEARMMRVFGTADYRAVPWPLLEWISDHQVYYHQRREAERGFQIPSPDE